MHQLIFTFSTQGLCKLLFLFTLKFIEFTLFGSFFTFHRSSFHKLFLHLQLWNSTSPFCSLFYIWHLYIIDLAIFWRQEWGGLDHEGSTVQTDWTQIQTGELLDIIIIRLWRKHWLLQLYSQYLSQYFIFVVVFKAGAICPGSTTFTVKFWKILVLHQSSFLLDILAWAQHSSVFFSCLGSQTVYSYTKGKPTLEAQQQIMKHKIK